MCADTPRSLSDTLCALGGGESLQTDCGKKMRARDPFCRFNDPMESFTFLLCGVSKPHSDPSNQGALSEASVGCQQFSPAF